MSNRDRYNVLWAKGEAEAANAHAKAHGLKHIPYDRIDADTDWRVYEIPPGIAKQKEEWIRRHPHFGGVFEPEGFGTLILPVSVEVVGPLGEMGAALSVDQGTEWHQNFVGAAQAWAVTRGLGAIGAITDNGLGPHPFTDPRLVEAKIFDLAETDAFGGSHGTPVTGCTVAIAPECGVTNYKIAGADVKCSWTDVSNAWLHAKKMGRKVVNTSWGGGSSSLAASTAATLKQAGIAIICAAGNSGTATQFPASDVNCYAVSALDPSGTIASFSCRGKIEICAPGVGLLTSTSGGGWASFSGTSGAAPIITGCVLLILACNPSWTGVQAIEHLMATATPKLPREHYGAGWPNVAVAVGAIVPAIPDKPAPPVVSEVAEGSALISWSVDGLMFVKLDQGDGKYEFQTIMSPTAQYRWSGLSAGTPYKVWIRAFNQFGESPRSDATPFTTLTSGAPPPPTTDPVPPPPEPPPPTTTMEAPTLVTLTSTSITFAWKGTGATGYELFQGGGYKFQQVGPTVLQYTWAPLSPGVAYRVAVKPLGGMIGPYLEFKTPASDTTPPPPPPPAPNAVEAQVAAIEAAWPTLSAADRSNTKSRIAALP